MGQPGLAMEAVNRYAEALAGRILEVLGEGTVSTVFVGGSVAAGTIAWYKGDELEVYSDVDLYVVVREGVVEASARRRAREAAASVRPPDGVRMVASPDVGVYTRDDLLAQPSRPGTADLATRHVLLFGEAGIFDALAERIDRVPDAREALYLVENRLGELEGYDASPVDPAHGRYRRYALLKTALDAGTAVLIARGEYAPRMEDRIRAFETVEDGGRLAECWDADLVTTAANGIRDLASYLSTSFEASFEARTRRFTARVWEAIAADVFGGREPGVLVDRRCRRGDQLRNYREFVAMCARLGHARRKRLFWGAALALYSPMDALRVWSLANEVVVHARHQPTGATALEGLGDYLTRLTRTCGFGQGTLSERVRAMHDAVA